jgi:hypothetical protein
MTNSNSSSSPGNSPGDILNDLRQLVATVPPPPSPLLAIVHPSDLDQLLLDLEAAELANRREAPHSPEGECRDESQAR